MCKLLALASLHNASHGKVQKHATADNPWRRFLLLDGIELPPTKNTIWAYAKILAESGQMPELCARLTAQMPAAGYTPEKVQLIDSTWVRVPKQRNTQAENDARKNGQLPPDWATQPHQLRPQDRDATWRRKNREWVFGYKNHVNVDLKHKLIMAFKVTTASTHDSPPFESLLRLADTCRGVWADRAYWSAPVGQMLQDRSYDNPAWHLVPPIGCARAAGKSMPRAGAFPSRTCVRRYLPAVGSPEFRTIGLTRGGCGWG